jgi:hypothetical protein
MSASSILSRFRMQRECRIGTVFLMLTPATGKYEVRFQLF